jgi:hypothetical protein
MELVVFVDDDLKSQDRRPVCKRGSVLRTRRLAQASFLVALVARSRETLDALRRAIAIDVSSALCGH